MGKNHQAIGKVSLTLLLITGTLIQAGNSVPVGHATEPGKKDRDQSMPSYDEEQQLKDLKQSLGKTFSILKSQVSVQYADQNSNQGTKVERKEEATEDGKLVARLSQKLESIQAAGANATPSSRISTEVEIPSRGIHQLVEEPFGVGQREIVDNVERRSPTPALADISNQIDGKYTSFSGVQYSPRDMAEYVFWTGDEKGVTLAIEEFLEDGLMTRKDAISFLQEIKTNLDDLQLHYSRQQRFQKHVDRDGAESQQAKENVGSIQRSLNKKNINEKVDVDGKERKDMSMAKKNSQHPPSARESMQDDQEASMEQEQQNREISDADYDELLDRLKVADFLYTEYSLEEVIYQLAKVIFSQSLTKGSVDAQEALQKFTNFLESEAEKGHISKSLEKKVLDVLIASFADTIGEHPDLVVKSRPRNPEPEETHSPSANQLLHQLVMLNPHAATGSAQADHVNLGKQTPEIKYRVEDDTKVTDGSKTKATRE